ncbi:class I tRNA ligase family protein [Planctomicrobium sp. SH664]|uniref:class I tRNA ligase family protein n=1 Tax=Planctomicrobium sp. SH664 TaxID=3448125 RepID=UPI003F5BB065
MFQKVDQAQFLDGEHEVLRFWREQDIFRKLQRQNSHGPRWSFLDGPITANNPMGVHHAWGRTYKDVYQRYHAMLGCQLRYQNGFDCQGLWVEVEVEKQLNLGTKSAIEKFGIDTFTRECKKRVLKYAARQTEQSIRLGYWMEWDDPDQLRTLADAIGPEEKPVEYVTARGSRVTGPAELLTAQLGNPEWGGSYFTFSTENNETIWSFLKKCFERNKVYRGHDVMPWSGRGGSAYSQMEVADGRKLTTHKSVFVRFPIIRDSSEHEASASAASGPSATDREYLLIWTTTPWTLTSNVAAAINPDLDYLKIRAKKDGAIYYFAKDNLNFKRLEKEFKEGFGRPEWSWPEGVGKLKSIGQIFKEQGGYEELATLKGAEMVGWRYAGPFDELDAQQVPGGNPGEVDSKERIKRLVNSGTPYTNRGNESALTPHILTLNELSARQESYAPDEAMRQLEQVLVALQELISIAISMGVCRLPIPAAELSELKFTLKQLGVPIVDSTSWKHIEIYGTQIQLIAGGKSPVPATNFQKLADAVIEVFTKLQSELADIPVRSGKDSHRVIDGGRDSKGSPNVVAGEGTGIVHVAPGCGDIDHKMGVELGLPVIAPLREDGTYQEGFGPFTGKEAISPATAEMVFEELKKKDLLVSVETYPHIYPHCWRTGDELVFRLVDEWFINMDWRDEIKEVTKCINWLPDSIQGQERELEWLTTMRDWMISKKRFWGLALPIWIDPENPSDFEVMGSLAELKERAVEGWDEFEGHTPHRPWIDKVKIRSQKTGKILTRVEDVGNPWLDAGIVPFSTLNYNGRYSSELTNWKDWYPADFVTECFPGQFRNWFYSMLSLATMMRYDETENAEEKKPFKNLLGHRLVMDESGKPMHKSDGTAIWFEEAAEQLGVDTLRWMYLAQNPATDLKFGTRYRNEPVTLQTIDGPITQTKEGLPTCKVTSKPADDVRRQVLIPLWNSYAFFVNYAVLDQFDPNLPQVPLANRPEIDRWVLSRLQELIGIAHTSLEAYRVADFMQAATEFIDDLSNWYIRRNRRRFWKPRSPSEDATSASVAWDADKLGAYQTLYEVLVTLTKLLAPAIPFLTERMYQNLVADGTPDAPQSVHLCRYPTVDAEKLDADLNWKTQQVQTLVTMGHRLREAAEQRVRQPLAELRFAANDPRQAEALEHYRDVIADELNVKQITRAEHLDELVSYSFKPNLKTLGPKYGKLLNAIRTQLSEIDPQILAPLRAGQSVEVTIGGENVLLAPDDVLVSVQQASDWASADAGGIQIALSTRLTPELIHEGMARDFIRQVQQLRKDANLQENQRIQVLWRPAGLSPAKEVELTVAAWESTILQETRANSIQHVEAPPADGKQVNLGEVSVVLAIVTV